jgi:hypothetical protein
MKDNIKHQLGHSVPNPMTHKAIMDAKRNAKKKAKTYQNLDQLKSDILK